MRKQESIHLHALLAEVARRFEECADVPDPDLTEYHALGVKPTSLHRSKTEHERASRMLAAALGRAVDGSLEQRQHTR